MIKRAIRNLHSNKTVPTRVFDVIAEGGKLELEVKLNKNSFERIAWGDVVYQVETVRKEIEKEITE